MIHDTVIEDHGMWQWTLAVSGGNVIARVGIPYDGVLTFSTESRPNTADTNSEYQLDIHEVVRRYVKESETEHDVDDLLERVQEALNTPEATDHD